MEGSGGGCSGASAEATILPSNSDSNHTVTEWFSLPYGSSCSVYLIFKCVFLVFSLTLIFSQYYPVWFTFFCFILIKHNDVTSSNKTLV